VTGPWTLVLPDGLDDDYWALTETRGVLLHLVFRHARGQFPAIAFDPYRIVQDADYMIEREPFYEPNVVLVHAVTRESVLREGERLGQRGHLNWLLDIGAAPPADWSLVVPESADWSRIGERGTLSAALGYGEKRFPVTFFDVAGLAIAVGWDDLDDLIHRRKEPRPVEFDEMNVIVLSVLSKETVEWAVAELARRHEFDWLLGQ
jgi:hypothetical protein